MVHDVFISYSSKNIETALAICHVLEENKIRCWMAPRDIPSGAEYGDIIEEAIINCKIFLLIFSKPAALSQWVKGELNLAFSEAKHITPYKIDETPLTGAMRLMLNQTHWIDAYPNPSDSFEMLLKSTAQTLGIALEDKATNNGKEDSKSKGSDADIFMEQSYQMGMEAVLDYDLNTAFYNLFHCALSDYKDSRNQVSYIIGSRTRVHKLDDNNIDYASEECDKGNSFAQCVMSRIYGLKTSDDKMQFEYAQLSANQNDKFGLVALAICYDLGVGVEKNYRLYNQLMNRALYMDCGIAIIYLAKDILYGWHNKQNVKKAIELLEKAMDKNVPESYLVMGDLYKEGVHIARDLEKSEQLYNKAISLGYVEAYQDLFNLYMYDPDTNKVKNVVKALEHLNKGVALGEAHCYYALACLYYCGNGVQKNIKNALKWLKQAAALGETDSLYLIGIIYYNGEDGSQPNYAEAWRFLNKGHKVINSNCSYLLGMMCLEGYGQDNKTNADCVDYFEKAGFACGYNGAEALLKLYDLYRTENIEHYDCLKGYEKSVFLNYPWITKDDDKAILYLKRAAELNHATAKYRYGVLLTDLNLPYSNELEGMKLLEDALKMGEKRAAVRLCYLYYEGVIVPKDMVKAKELCKIGIDADETVALVPYYSILLDEFNKDESNDMYEDNEKNREIRSFIDKAVERKVPQAILDFGIFQHYGVHGYKSRTDTTMSLFEQAANLGSKNAANTLGGIYHDNDTEFISMDDKDDATALKWYKLAKSLGHTESDEKIQMLEERLKQKD